MSFALVFPGQGSQYVGMGRVLAQRFSLVRETFDEADAALGFSISRLCFEGPESELALTPNTQPAILALSVACYRLFARHIDARPTVVLGHSLGEYSALVASGVFTFEDAVRAVRLRGSLMESAVPAGKGGMAALLGLDVPQVEAICREARAVGVVSPATLNCPGQVVIAGETAALERAIELAQAGGARRSQMLNVSGPFHSPLLASVGEKLAAHLAQLPLQPANVPVLANVTADYVTRPDAVRSALVRQVSCAVRWEESVRRALADGVDTFVELGPGRVLSGLVRRIDKSAQILNAEDPDSWEKVLAWAKGDSVR